MEIRTHSCSIWAILFGVWVLTLSNVNAIHNTKDLERKVVALFKAVDYMARRPEQMNVDAVFGITLTEAHLKATLTHQNMHLFGSKLAEIIRSLSDLCRYAREYMKPKINRKTEKYTILNNGINQSERWMKRINWSLGALGPRPLPSPGASVKQSKNMFHLGTPQEQESDACLTEIVADSVDGKCKVSDYCSGMLLRKDYTRGYPLTHRLLYVQAAMALGCKENPIIKFSLLIPIYCRAVLQDTVDLEYTGLPDIARDMIMEQVALCGMEGYTEFANDHYASMILDWPNSAGCFSALGFTTNSHNRVKRNSDVTDYGCDNHATALGAASLALLIRAQIETAALK